jgi:hypothetical protein
MRNHMSALPPNAFSNRKAISGLTAVLACITLLNF